MRRHVPMQEIFFSCIGTDCRRLPRSVTSVSIAPSPETQKRRKPQKLRPRSAIRSFFTSFFFSRTPRSSPIGERSVDMIQLLFSLLAVEVLLVVVLLFKTPLRKLAILGLNRLKRGRGPVMVKTVAGTVLLVLGSSVYSMVKISQQVSEVGGALTPTDQVLMSRHLLEASLMGYSLFLALVVDRLHHYIRELRSLGKSMEAVMKQNRALEESKSAGSSEVSSRDKEIASLKEQIKRLKSESEGRLKEVKAAETNALALRKQSEGFLLEYDRLLEDNQNLRSQLQSIDHHLSKSESKKSA